MKTRILLLAMLCCAITSATFAQNVYVTSSPMANFSSYHTYAWGRGANPNQLAESFLAQEAEKQINMQLQAKGYTMVQESQNPDLIVVANGAMKESTSYNLYGMRMIGGGMGSINQQQNFNGNLVVDIYDTHQKELVWRGMGSESLNQKNSQKNMQNMDKMVAKMFKKYPH